MQKQSISVTFGLFLLVTLLLGCSHTTNTALARFESDPDRSYRFNPTKADGDTLVVVTLSGGGIRAAALSFGALQTLAGLTGTGDDTLLDQVDIISSVSGGSVTAGWYALKGRAGLNPPYDGNSLWNFLYHDWTPELAWRGLNPVTAVRYAFSDYSRSDLLSGFFADKLYGDATYGAILDRYRNDKHQPYVILNSTDLGHETGFQFTQGQFDRICSDLSRYHLADAVAASANFPLVFSATGLKNHSNCEAQHSNAWNNDGPPQWIKHYDQFSMPISHTANAYQLTELRQARQAKTLIDSNPRDSYIHLLDGGLIDNLGVRSTLAIEDDPARVPGLYLRLGAPRRDGMPVRPNGYENIRRLLYIVVNARTRDPANLDQREYPPGEIATTLRMIDTQLDNSILDDEAYLIAQLEAIANRETPKPNAALPPPPFLSAKTAAQATHSLPMSTPGLTFYSVAVDFDQIPDPECRERYWALGTNWGLKNRQIKALIELAKVLVGNSNDLREFYKDIGKPALAPKPTDFKEVCDVNQM